MSITLSLANNADYVCRVSRFSIVLIVCGASVLGISRPLKAEKLFSAAAPTPSYSFSKKDPVWTRVGSTNEWRVPASAYDYQNELYELPVEGDKWTIGGGFISTTFKYYEYIDMEEAKWGSDNSYIYFSWDTAGSRIYDSGFKDHGYLGHYYAYFGVPNGNDLLVEIPGGKADILGDTFSDVSGDLKVFEDANNAIASAAGNDVPGPGGNVSDITTTGQGGDGFDTEVSAATIEARRDDDVVEVAVDLTSVGLTPNAAKSLEYMYIGVAETNPSGVGDLFANDHYVENVPTNTVEYDNVLLAVPEPESLIMACMALMTLSYCVWRRIVLGVG